MSPTTRRHWTITLLSAVAFVAGCSGAGGTGDVTGTVTVDNQTPPPGSTITFIPLDGKSPTAGALIQEGKYSTRVPVGTAKVEIRMPRKVGKLQKEGPGSEADSIQESLPAKYHDQTELKLEVKPGANEKNWDLTTK